MQFSQISGLIDIKSRLINAVKNNHIAHAQLFSGHEGSGNLALAIAFATFINCENKLEDDSCGKCASCSKYNKLIHPDLHFVFPVSTTKEVTKDPLSKLFIKDWRKFISENPYGDINCWGGYMGAENKQLSISVDESRNIVKTISLKAFEAEYKVLIIWLVETMNQSASNSILKVLEEPPEKTIFFLITNNAEKIIPTILSRTQRMNIRSFKDVELIEELISRHSIEEKSAKQIAYLSDGNMNEGIRLLSEIEEDTHIMFREWMRKCYKKNNIAELVNASEDFQKKGREGQKSFLIYGLSIMRECLISPFAKDLIRLQSDEMQFVEGFSKIITWEKIEKINNQLTDACYHIERNANAKIVFLDTSLTISGILKTT